MNSKPDITLIQQFNVTGCSNKIFKEKFIYFLNKYRVKAMQEIKVFWLNLQNDLMHQEITKYILSGKLPLSLQEKWLNEYLEFIEAKLKPFWFEAIVESNNYFDKYNLTLSIDTDRIKKTVSKEKLNLATNLSQQQYRATNGLIQKVNKNKKIGPDEMSRIIRPMLGLVPRETAAVRRYYEYWRQKGLKAGEAHEATMIQIKKLRSQRAMRIATTQLVYFYNLGKAEGIKQLQTIGLLGNVKKVWVTADKERYCFICGPLDSMKVDQEATFPGGYSIPPAHPWCECTINYEFH